MTKNKIRCPKCHKVKYTSYLHDAFFGCSNCKKTFELKDNDRIVFFDYKTRLVLASIDIGGLVDGEIRETARLLAYEKNVPVSQIRWEVNPDEN